MNNKRLMLQYQEELMKSTEIKTKIDELEKRNKMITHALDEYQNIIKDLKEKNKQLENSNSNINCNYSKYINNKIKILTIDLQF